MSDRGLLLGFYPGRDSADEALRELKRRGHRRVAVMHRTSSETIKSSSRFGRRRLALPGAAGLIGLLIGLIGYKILLPAHPLDVIALLVAPTAVGIVAGAVVARRYLIEIELGDADLSSPDRWLVSGDSALAVQGLPDELARAVGTMRSLGDITPAIFALQAPPRYVPSVDLVYRAPLSVGQLEDHARRLATEHHVTLDASLGEPLLSRLDHSERVIGYVRSSLAAAARLEQSISPAAEWILDNAYVVQEHIRDVRLNLPDRFLHELPVLVDPGQQADGFVGHEGVPRVYALAEEVVRQTDGQVDRETITRFLDAYQEQVPLDIGELWAMPLMIRIAIIERVRRLAEMVDARLREREAADFWANRLLTGARRDPERLFFVLAELSRVRPQPSDTFASQLTVNLHDEDAALVPIQSWLERTLNKPLADIILQEQGRQAATQVSIGNVITTLRQLSRLDWRAVFEHLSLVERALGDDPAGVYRSMDFDTRDRYRAAVEELARGSEATELEVARQAVALADANAEGDPGTEHLRHVGTYLIDSGRPELVAAVAAKESRHRRRLRWIYGHHTTLYLGSIALSTLLLTVPVAAALARSRAPWEAWAVVLLVALLPASQLAIQIVNYWVTRLLPPRVLAKMSFADGGIPDAFRTLVVVPMLLVDETTLSDEVEKLEVRYLANPDDNLQFGLLADYRDCDQKQTEGDARLLDHAVRAIEGLNQQYGADRFYLFVRDREWCETEQKYIGWERKRGKLEELNALISGEPVRGGAGIVRVGDADQLMNIRFVITLDSDTQLPRDTARHLVETLAHPLNRPRRGATYGELGPATIVQPRVSTSLPSAMATPFSRLFTDPVGTDPYTRAVSDVYQDLSGEGSYIGKGIYDPRVFHRALGGRFRDETLLSHDLIEGAHVRTALASDIELLDEFPPDYVTYTRRQHRWIRGDWQIAEWFLPWVPAPDGGRTRNTLSLLNRWKVFDNLRRSLVPAASVAFLVASWLVSPWLGAVASVLLAVLMLFQPTAQIATRATTGGEHGIQWPSWRNDTKRAFVETVLLVHQAGMALDAVGRALYRRLVSRKKLLEWTTAQVASWQSAGSATAFLVHMGIVSVFAALVGAALWLAQPASLVPAAPFLALWLIAPLVARHLTVRPQRAARRAAIPERDLLSLRRAARRTWRYYDDLVGPATSWLPPDNYQVSHTRELALRTSPTNIGLYLLCVLASNDLGYTPPDDVIARLDSAFDSLSRLELYHGHLLNWYDIAELQPLEPRFVSTVDSGNLLGSLWALEQGLLETLDSPPLGRQAIEGLADTVGVLRESLDLAKVNDDASRRAILRQAREAVDEIESRLRTDELVAVVEMARLLRRVQPKATELARLLRDDALGDALGDALSGEPSDGLGGESSNVPGDAMRLGETAAALSSVEPSREPGSSQPADGGPPHSGAIGAPLGTEPAYWSALVESQIEGWLALYDSELAWLEALADANSEVQTALDEEERADLRRLVRAGPSTSALASGDVPAARNVVAAAKTTIGTDAARDWATRIEASLASAVEHTAERRKRTEHLVAAARRLADGANMRFLYDAERRLFSIGFNVDDQRLDGSLYDLLASEARLTSFIAVARGDVPAEHWLALDRPVGVVGGRKALLSWSGTMFEYLMPSLLLHVTPNSLLDMAARQAVAVQIDYASSLDVPWGISESAYADLDANKTYQYKAFGVPGLGFKRGLGDDLVIAPYATLLALSVDPAAAVANLRRLDALGMYNEFGYYEALDFNRRSEREGRRGIFVRAYMAHHQGMGLLAIDNLVRDDAMQRRFHADPHVAATEALLYERIPAAPPLRQTPIREGARVTAVTSEIAPSASRFETPHTDSPKTQLLSNGRYSVMLTGAGGGYSEWDGLELTRWRADPTRDNWGTFVYLRDLDRGHVWSAGHQPVCAEADSYSVQFHADRAEIRRRDHGVVTETQVVVSQEGDAEIRRISLVNRTSRTRRVELTTYSEPTLAPHAADRQHPAFNSLFIETQVDIDRGALLAFRRPRNPDEQPVFVAQRLTSADVSDGPMEYETDRARFIGRGRSTADPALLRGELSCTAGLVLDPILSLRRTIELRPGQRSTVTLVMAAGDSREAALELTDKYASPQSVDRAMELAWARSQLEMRQLRLRPDEARRFQQLASYMLYPSARLRPGSERLEQNTKDQSGLWAHGVSGDLPIALVTVGEERDIGVVREMLQAHTYWRHHGLKADLVILNEAPGGYERPLREQLARLVHGYSMYTGIDQPGGVFLRDSDQMPDDDVTLLQSAARIAVVAARGPTAQQLGVPVEAPEAPEPLTGGRGREEPSSPLTHVELAHGCGIGGFSPDGSEYVVDLSDGQSAPAPWSNVLANPEFGALVTEAGSGFAWFGNSQRNRLTPWSNDPVSDPPGEALYIRDEDSGRFWTPTALPVREAEGYRVRHGAGYSVFEHNSHAIEQTLTVFVPLDDDGGDPVKVQRLSLVNDSRRARRLTVTYYADLVLGESREESLPHVATYWDDSERMILARNRYNGDYGDRIAFATLSPRPSSHTGHRTSFIGRNGSLADPAGMHDVELAARHGAGLDPCVALRVEIELGPGQHADVVALLGETETAEDARRLVRTYRDAPALEEALGRTRGWWDARLGAVEVDLPEPTANVLVNRWLLYQTVSCRLWARSGFYQSGGAYGFRDQLQDAMALVYAAPELARAQIMTAARRQFRAGDVQHWWHPPSGAGVRTRISDDLLWLPFVVAHYVRVTGDRDILGQQLPFIEARRLGEVEREAYLVPSESLEQASLYEHCRRAIERGATRGPHGLPLIGAGDWNDGLNRVGLGGTGESVWLAWFLLAVLRDFAEVADGEGRPEDAAAYRRRASAYLEAIEAGAWDGRWYRRAYFDDGTPLGSETSEEARIDSLPQAWAWLATGGDHDRARQALDSAWEQLVLPADRMALLFTPPFDKCAKDPGYIKGYPPGVRENGGQYTHAAVWLAMAAARSDDGRRAASLLQALNPIEHALDPSGLERYRTEPYAVAADVYSLEGRLGRGGWTWYTGSAAWLYRAWIEEIMGLRITGDVLELDPVVPPEWPGFKMRYRRGEAIYEITVANPDGVARGVAAVALDGRSLDSRQIPLESGPVKHKVTVRLGS